MPPKKATITTEGTRRSARVASTSANAVAKKAAPENGAAGKKKRTKVDAGSADENESSGDEGTEKPKTKKVCLKLLLHSL